nr:PIG-L family deacetylase [Klebsiella variicola]
MKDIFRRCFILPGYAKHNSSNLNGKYPQKKCFSGKCPFSRFCLVSRRSNCIACAKGYDVHVVCLSYGERDESTKLWRKGNMTEEMVKQHRRIEAQAAADILDVSIEFFHLGDYPLRAEQDTLFRLADVFRSVQPHFVLTHSIADPSNYDHPLAANLTQEARLIAQAEGFAQVRQ